ncbi:regulator of chromosome condensation 1/beta-lactamase-inhibitor protein II [Polychytrium aggregatum]|uniref:regulator of chromosome condensation 1/beta-lactamase-inhibitor protein II n=1 Tax=Polychytrium aggregatum TaxID=110093 RepID=UPI0022FE9455|nr:regulator of chromosome condensation 1/beta-lactamase-inhibitor protein II [Polychytrium aggregatum]KAI9202852.1 regulator of chromosome condensation 1/beta-lactamase-inhibitor protein II [Polychytrium aggregatum]
MSALLAFGSNSHGQLGIASSSDAHCPEPALEDSFLISAVAVSLSGGANHSAMVLDDGSLVTWGDNSQGQLGRQPGKASSQADLVQTQPSHRWAKVRCGWNHTAALDQDGILWTFGENRYGQLGYDTGGAESSCTATSVRGLPGPVVDVDCGIRHTVAVLENGQVWAWGCNRSGQLGQRQSDAGNSKSNLAPFQPLRIQGIDNGAAVACGQKHTIILTLDGEIYALGWNRHGQLGQQPSSIKSTAVPRRIDLPEATTDPVRQVCSGWSHSMALTASGAVYAWGRNDHGQLGIKHDELAARSSGATASQPTPLCWKPVRIPLQCGRVSSIVCGSEHVLAVDEDGRCHAWGWNEHGNCGNGATRDCEPTILEGIVGRVSVAGCGCGHSLVCIRSADRRV